MTIGKVSLERKGHVLCMGLDRAAKRNAFDLPLLQALGKAYAELDGDDALRAGVLFAHGDHFTAGLDLPQFGDAFAAGVWPVEPGSLDPLGLATRPVGKPIVVAVQGTCLTLGIELLLSADIRVAAESVRFAQIEVKRGIYPVCGATLRFPRECGWGNAMRYLLTGDDFGGQEALRIGLVQEVVATGRELERATELARGIAEQAPLGVRATLASSRRAVPRSEREAAERLLPDLAPLMKSDDVQEGLRSFLERRKASFQGQ